MEMSYYFLSCLFLYFITKHFLWKFKNLPPSPFLTLPIVGHLYLLKKPLHRTLAKLSNDYGPVLLLCFGSHPVLFVSSPSAAEECFTKNDITFANRPKLLAAKYLGANYSTFTWSSYGRRWRSLRKIASLNIFSNSRIQMFESICSKEIQSLIMHLFRGSSLDGQIQTMEMKSAFFDLQFNIITMFITGKRFYGDDMVELEETRKFRDIVPDTFKFSGATNIGDFVLFLSWFGPTLTEKKLIEIRDSRDESLLLLIDEHRRMRGDSCFEERNKTLVDVLLSLQESEPECYTDETIRGLSRL